MGNIISDKGISGDPKKIEAMMSRPASRKLTDVKYFVGIARHCRKFTKGYSAGKVEPRYRLERPTSELILPWRYGPCVYAHTYEDFLNTRVE